MELRVIICLDSLASGGGFISEGVRLLRVSLMRLASPLRCFKVIGLAKSVCFPDVDSLLSPFSLGV
jgi:hypothetical protein